MKWAQKVVAQADSDKDKWHIKGGTGLDLSIVASEKRVKEFAFDLKWRIEISLNLFLEKFR